MANNAKTVKRNMPMSIACVLLCLVLITVYLVCGLYAKFTTSGSGTDDSLVAKFDITEDDLLIGEELVFDFAPGTYINEIKVTNSSEVAVNYTITVTNETLNIPLQFALGEASSIEGAATTADTVTATYSMGANSTEIYALKVVWDQADALDHMGMVDMVTIEVNAEQID